jgi:hypothetical protein
MIKISSIKANPNNPRIIKNEKFEKLKRSIEEFPEMMELRPIVVDENNVIIGGNMRFRALQDLGKKEVPNSWIKKASELTEDQKKRFVITDNSSFGEWEWEAIKSDWDLGFVADWGVDIPEFGNDNQEEKENIYTQKVNAPLYEPKNEKPQIKDLCDQKRYNRLLSEIKASDLDEETKAFLKLAAARHIVFNYERIADFYSHSEPKVQSLMEHSALVIIDFGKAIELGFVRLTDEISQIYQNEYDNE